MLLGNTKQMFLKLSYLFQFYFSFNRLLRTYDIPPHSSSSSSFLMYFFIWVHPYQPSSFFTPHPVMCLLKNKNLQHFKFFVTFFSLKSEWMRTKKMCSIDSKFWLSLDTVVILIYWLSFIAHIMDLCWDKLSCNAVKYKKILMKISASTVQLSKLKPSISMPSIIVSIVINILKCINLSGDDIRIIWWIFESQLCLVERENNL